MSAAEWFVDLLAAYAVAGVLFAIAFVTAGVQRIDSQAKGSGAAFRALIFPGAAALWPLLLRRWCSGAADPVVESNPHRRAARGEASP
jgi:uncharacterized membrane protein YphA (DoxX/SURF4 family)